MGGELKLPRCASFFSGATTEKYYLYYLKLETRYRYNSSISCTSRTVKFSLRKYGAMLIFSFSALASPTAKTLPVSCAFTEKLIIKNIKLMNENFITVSYRGNANTIEPRRTKLV